MDNVVILAAHYSTHYVASIIYYVSIEVSRVESHETITGIQSDII